MTSTGSKTGSERGSKAQLESAYHVRVIDPSPDQLNNIRIPDHLVSGFTLGDPSQLHFIMYRTKEPPKAVPTIYFHADERQESEIEKIITGTLGGTKTEGNSIVLPSELLQKQIADLTLTTALKAFKNISLEVSYEAVPVEYILNPGIPKEKIVVEVDGRLADYAEWKDWRERRKMGYPRELRYRQSPTQEIIYRAQRQLVEQNKIIAAQGKLLAQQGKLITTEGQNITGLGKTIRWLKGSLWAMGVAGVAIVGGLIYTIHSVNYNWLSMDELEQKLEEGDIGSVQKKYTKVRMASSLTLITAGYEWLYDGIPHGDVIVGLERHVETILKTHREGGQPDRQLFESIKKMVDHDDVRKVMKEEQFDLRRLRDFKKKLEDAEMELWLSKI